MHARGLDDGRSWRSRCPASTSSSCSPSSPKTRRLRRRRRSSRRHRGRVVNASPTFAPRSGPAPSPGSRTLVDSNRRAARSAHGSRRLREDAKTTSTRPAELYGREPGAQTRASAPSCRTLNTHKDLRAVAWSMRLHPGPRLRVVDTASTHARGTRRLPGAVLAIDGSTVGSDRSPRLRRARDGRRVLVVTRSPSGCPQRDARSRSTRSQLAAAISRGYGGLPSLPTVEGR